MPIAIQLIGPEQIDKVGAVNLAQVADFVPGLTIDASQPTQPSYSLRGLGNGDFGIGTDAPVGVYVNGVYTGKTGGALLNFNDVKRVEVLKGPQGTLFGRNSAGGAISIVTNDPDGQNLALGPRARRQLRHGARRGRRQPRAERGLRPAHLGGRREERRLGHQRRRRQEEPAGARPGARAWARAGRRSDDTSVVLTWEHEDLNERPRPIWAVGHVRRATASSSYIDPRHEQLRNDVIGGVESRLFNGVNLRIEHELSDKILFTSTTGWRHFNSVNLEDNDGTDNPATYLATGNFEKSTTFEQEFRLNGKSKLADWLVGASFSDRALRADEPRRHQHDDARPGAVPGAQRRGRGPAGAAVLAADRHRPGGRHPRLRPAGPELAGGHAQHAGRALRGADGRRDLARGRPAPT